MWNWRMLLATGEGRFADVMEQTLYNGLLSGISLDGKNYFYVNPLEDRGKHRRQPWYEVACCPLNLARTLGSIQNYVYAVSEDGIWIHLYEESKAKINLSNHDILISQKTAYPYEGKVKIEISVNSPSEFTLFLRIPGWTDGKFNVDVNGNPIKSVVEKGYLKIKMIWEKDIVTIEFPMKIKKVKSNSFVRENTDKVAITRGPVVYCAEACDNPEFDVWNLTVGTSKIREERENNIVVLKGNGFAKEDNWDLLYQEKGKDKNVHRQVEFTLVPYHMWANRKPGPMAVWLFDRKG